MLITTASGAQYFGEVRQTERGPCLFVQKDGMASALPVVAVYPDRLPFLMATETVVQEGDRAVGRHANGTVTIRVIPDQVRKGMVLANRRGFLSTTITAVR